MSKRNLWPWNLRNPVQANVKSKRTLGRAAASQFETLETRRLLSAFTVTSLADSGPGSLRGAVTAANSTPGADIINFAAHPGIIALTSGEIEITGSLTINGPGAAVLAISGNNTTRIFNVQGGTDPSTAIDVTISGLTISKGQNFADGALRNAGYSTLSLNGDSFIANRAIGSPTSPAFGGAIATFGTGNTLNVSNCLFQGNTADGTVTGQAGSGGAIFASFGAVVNLRTSVLSGNRALDGGLGTGQGGALYLASATANVTNCVISGNQSIGGNGNYGNAYGGGIAAFQSSVTLSGDSLIDNQTTAGTGMKDATASGGGLFAFLSSVSVSDSTISGNQAVGGTSNQTSGNPYAGSFGGGVSMYYSDITIDKSTITGNRSAAGYTPNLPGSFGLGGGIDLDGSDGTPSKITRSVIASNEVIGGTGISGQQQGTADGGGIRMKNATLTVDQSFITNNRSIGGAHGGNGQAGGILDSVNCSLTMNNTVISGNQAIGGDGGNANSWMQANGGGLAVFFSSDANISNCLFTNNQAIGGNGAVADGTDSSMGTASGGAIFALFGCTIEINSSSLTNNSATAGSHIISTSPDEIDVATGHGGAISANEGVVMTISNSTISHNSAVGGNSNTGTGFTGFIGDGVGGGIENSIDGTVVGYGPTQTTVSNCIITGNSAIGGNDNVGTGVGSTVLVGDGMGGGSDTDLGAAASISNSLIDNNTAVGGLRNSSTTGLPANSGIGGGVFGGLGGFAFDPSDVLAASIVNLSGVIITRNTAVGGAANLFGAPGGNGLGGAIAAISDADFTISSSTIAHNIASGGQAVGRTSGGNGFGGGAYNDATSTYVVNKTSITGNLASRGGTGAKGIGGGVYNLGLFSADALTTIFGNSATDGSDNVFGPVISI